VSALRPIRCVHCSSQRPPGREPCPHCGGEPLAHKQTPEEFWQRIQDAQERGDERVLALARRPGAIRRLDNACTYLVDDHEHGEATTFAVTLAAEAQTCTCWERSRSSAHCRHIRAAIAYEQTQAK